MELISFCGTLCSWESSKSLEIHKILEGFGLEGTLKIIQFQSPTFSTHFFPFPMGRNCVIAHVWPEVSFKHMALAGWKATPGSISHLCFLFHEEFFRLLFILEFLHKIYFHSELKFKRKKIYFWRFKFLLKINCCFLLFPIRSLLLFLYGVCY